MLWPAAGQKIVHLGERWFLFGLQKRVRVFWCGFFLFPVSGDYLDLCLRFYMIFLKNQRVSEY